MIKKVLNYLKELPSILLIAVFVILLYENIMTTQDNQDVLNELAKKAKVAPKHSQVWHVEQWVGNHLK